MRLWPGNVRDDEAFTEFVSAIGPRLFRTALLLCGDWHLAEDLVQTTLGKLYVAWPRVQGANSPEAYARGALTKTFLSYTRVRRNAEQPTLDLGIDLASSADGTIRIELFDALESLESLDRAIVVLRYWSDRSVEQTAIEVGLSPGAVRTRASRALTRLRAELSDGTTDTRAASK